MNAAVMNVAGRNAAGRTKTGWLVVVLALLAWTAAQDADFVLRGEVPEGAPAGLEVHAQVAVDLVVVDTESVHHAVVEGDRFELALPDTIDPALLDETRLSCEGPVPEVAIVPFLSVVLDGEELGRLWRTDMPVDAWNAARPTRFAYAIYLAEPYANQSDCWGDVVDVAFQPGWNHYVRVPTDGGSLVESDPPGDDFVWRFVPAR